MGLTKLTPPPPPLDTPLNVALTIFFKNVRKSKTTRDAGIGVH